MGLGATAKTAWTPGPALCLYFAALRSTTNPPSVPLPRESRSKPPRELSEDNCPPTFLSFFRVWAATVHKIQGLEPNLQHDLARIICGLAPLTDPPIPILSGIAADLRAVAIEISQRRSFQDRYASDLQAALDAGGASSSLKVKASFVPPPLYDGPGPSSPTKKSLASSSSLDSSKLYSTNFPALDFIRETLYAAVADVLERMPSIRRLLKWDPPRAYFSSVAFAILDVATSAVTPEGTIVGILGRELTLAECPRELKPFMMELVAIGRTARQITEEDDLQMAQCLQNGEEAPEPRLDRVRKMLEGGVGYDRTQADDDSERRRSVEGRAVVFTNRINALGLGILQIKTFRERQAEVFNILGGVGS